jgi:flavin reductase (DIM6/NTAB) family NADH-FMN oxidoreductase RutF
MISSSIYCIIADEILQNFSVFLIIFLFTRLVKNTVYNYPAFFLGFFVYFFIPHRQWFLKAFFKNNIMVKIRKIRREYIMHTFQPYPMNMLEFNPFQKIGSEWAAVTAEADGKANAMTVSWGGVGVMWGKNVATIYIRDSRYTKEFVDREDYFTLAFFGEEHREALNLCGRVSGRDEDKIKEAGLTPYYVDGTVAFEEAKMIFVCKKVYVQRMGEENFVEKANLDKWYADKDMHNMYMGEIKKILVKED